MKKLKSLNELFERALNFLTTIKPKDKFVLIHHKDLDGITSAVIFLKVLQKLGVKKPKIIASSNEEIENILKAVDRSDKIIILDVDIGYLWKELRSWKKNILIIDHHPPRKDLNDEKIIYLNPMLVEDIYQPVAYIIYKYFSKAVNLKEVEWIAVLGTIGDYGFEDCVELIKRWVRAKSKGALWKSKLGRAMKMVNGAISEFGFERTRKLLMSVKSIDELKDNKAVWHAFERYEKKYKSIKNDFWKNALKIKKLNLIISEIKTRHRVLSSPVASEISSSYPNRIIIILRRVNSRYAIHARCQKGMDMGKLMRECCKGLNGGGGHARAAGGTIPAGQIEIFKNRVIKELERQI